MIKSCWNCKNLIGKDCYEPCKRRDELYTDEKNEFEDDCWEVREE